MSNQAPQTGPQRPGLIEYALIVALVAVLVIGILIVLLPAITTIVNSMHG
jgi:Flp pilus assembly pilin Flp